MSLGLIVGIVLLLATIVAFIFLLRTNPSAPRRHKRVIEDE